jgi:hypothetical protein
MIATFEIAKLQLFKEDTGWFVATTKDQERIVGTAIFPPSGIITAEGNWVNHTTYGRQFKATKVIFKDMTDIIGALLASGFLTGVKRSKAKIGRAHV